MIQMKLWNYDCTHAYVIMTRLIKGEPPQMVCVGCGADVDHTSVLREAAQKQREVHRCIRVTQL